MLNDPATCHVLKDPLWFRLQLSEDKVHAHQSNSVTQHGDVSSLLHSMGMLLLCPFSHSFLGQWVGACLCFNLLTKPSMVGWKKEWKVKHPTSYKPHPINQPTSYKPHPLPQASCTSGIGPWHFVEDWRWPEMVLLIELSLGQAEYPFGLTPMEGAVTGRVMSLNVQEFQHLGNNAIYF